MQFNNWKQLVSVLLICMATARTGMAAEAPAKSPAQKETPIFSCTFTPTGWNVKDWMFVRRDDMHNYNEWVQKPTYIESPKPGLDDHTSMVYKVPQKGDLKITSTMAFAKRMAPSIVFASGIRDGAQGKEYETHMELVIWSEGVNVWTHRTENGKAVWKQKAFARFPLADDTPYTLEVTKKGQELTLNVAGHTFGYVEETLPEEYYVGITGCEGINRFYDFAILPAAK